MAPQKQKEIETQDMQISTDKLVSNQQSSGISYLAGIIQTEDAYKFKRLVYRITRGTTMTFLNHIEKPFKDPEGKKDEVIRKTVFLIIYKGGQRNIIQSKLLRACNAFATSHPQNLPANKLSTQTKLLQIKTKLVELRQVMQSTYDTIRNTLHEYILPSFPESTCSKLEEYKLFILKEKLLNSNWCKLKEDHATYTGKCWIPISEEAKIAKALQQLTKLKPHIPQGYLERIRDTGRNIPPTYFRQNVVTAPAQQIVDTFSVPKYQEVNPALFTIISFPFQFGVMFGDMGHGFLIFVFTMWIFINQKSLKKAGLNVINQARYLLLFMSIFAMFGGSIYNEFFSIPINVFGSCYKNPLSGDITIRTPTDCTYPWGWDPKWFITQNELLFANSFKMKWAVILGVTQMIFGIFLKASNCAFFKDSLTFFAEFLPQILFMSGVFGYMIILIFLKWSQDWLATPKITPPSIITIMINLALKAGKLGDENAIYGPKNPDNSRSPDTQNSVQQILLLIAVICIPWMLIPKPIIQIKHQKLRVAKNKQRHIFDNDRALNETLEDKLLEPQFTDENPSINLQQQIIVKVDNKDQHCDSICSEEYDGKDEDYVDPGEIFIHQAIETIEFVLGGIAHTASYLRLWALSLAHGQLAKVFFSMTVGNGVANNSFLMIFGGFYVFLWVTFGVLMLMDVMECFLHALRLHWVEFQSKFYKGEGVRFIPYSFENLLEWANEQ